MELLSATAADGIRLGLRRFASRQERRSVALLTHAMWVNGSYFDRPLGSGFASELASHGVETFALDFRGHGLSEAPAGGWTFDDYVRLDLPAALERIAEIAGVEASGVDWIGHSLGGLVSIAAAGATPELAPRRLVLATTSLWRRPVLARRLAVELFLGAARLLGRAPIRRLGLGTDDEPRAYVEQLAGWCRTGRFTSADGSVSYDDMLHRVHMPILAVVGGKDRLCTLRDAEEVTARLSAPCRTLVISKRAGYDMDAGHFSLFTSPRARSAWQPIHTFLTAA